MASSVMRRPLWNPQPCLGLNPNFTCPGVAHTKTDKTCTRSRKSNDLEEGERVLRRIARFDPRSEALRIISLLQMLARCLLCRNNHINQVDMIVVMWTRKMNAADFSLTRTRQIRSIQPANQHAIEITALRDQHNTEIAALTDNHGTEIATLRTHHTTEIAALADNHGTEIAVLRTRHATEIDALNAQILELRSQNSRLSEEEDTLETELVGTKTELAQCNVSVLTYFSKLRIVYRGRGLKHGLGMVSSGSGLLGCLDCLRGGDCYGIGMIIMKSRIVQDHGLFKVTDCSRSRIVQGHGFFYF